MTRRNKHGCNSKVRGRVYKRSNSNTWVNEITIDGVVYLSDNTGSLPIIHDDATRCVEALTLILRAGHTLPKTRAELMEEA